MIRVELGEEIERRGKWRWACPEYDVEGISRQPLLDACREIKRMGGDPVSAAGLFRKGSRIADLTCSVGWGADHTVREDLTRFTKWRAFGGIADRAAPVASVEPAPQNVP